MPEKKFIYKCKVDKENGAWNTDDVGQHIKDRKLCAGLISFFKKEDEAGYETVRARNDKGRFVADDPDTPNVNEAYERVKK